MNKKTYKLELTNDEIVFLFGQLHMRELDFKKTLEQDFKTGSLEDVEMCMDFIRKIKSLQMKLDDCRLVDSIGDISID